MDEAIIPVAIKIEPKMLDTKNIKVEPEQNHSNTVENFEYVQLKSEPGDPQVRIKIEPVEDMEDSPETFDVSGLKVEMENRIIEKKELSIKDDDKEDVDKGNELGLSDEESLGRPPIDKEKLRFECTICSFKTMHKVSLRHHKLQHRHPSKVETHKCQKCSFTTKWRSSLNSHSQLHIEESPLQCIHCNFKGKNMISFRVHLHTHNGRAEEKSLCCKFCNFKTEYRNCLTFHKLKHMNLTESDKVKCEQCGFTAKHTSHLLIHTQVHKVSDTPKTKVYYREFIKCTQCPFQTLTMDTMKKHELTHKDLSEVESYACTDCGYTTKWKSSMTRHMLRHTEDYRFQCEQCDYKAKHKSAMTVHMLTHKETGGETEMYFCHNCDFATRRKGSLLMHMKRHSDSSYMKCPHCPFQCIRKHYMQRHVNSKHKL